MFYVEKETKINDPSLKTRTKSSIRYAKENDREKRERRRERERKVEGEIKRGMCAHSKQKVDQINVRPL